MPVYSFTGQLSSLLRPLANVPDRLWSVKLNSHPYLIHSFIILIRILILRIFFIRNTYVCIRKLLEEIGQMASVTARAGRCRVLSMGARRTGRHTRHTGRTGWRASYGLLVCVQLNQALCTYRCGDDDDGRAQETSGPNFGHPQQVGLQTVSSCINPS